MISAKYIAGLIDGEGSICLVRRNGNYSVTYSLHLFITNTDKHLLDTVAEAIGGKVYVADKKQSNDGHIRRPCFTLNVYGRNVGEVLRTIRPHLISKTHQADAAMQAASLSSKTGRHITEENRAKLSELSDYISWLNQGCP